MKIQVLLAAALLAGSLPVALSAQAPEVNPLAAQQPKAPLAGANQAPPAPDRPRTITLDVTVTQKSGAPVTGLTQSDFTVLNNKTPTPITTFRSVSAAQVPVEFLLILDAVNIPYTETNYVRNQLQGFLKANPHLPYPTTIGVLTDGGMKLTSGFTTDGNAIAEVLGQFQFGVRKFTNDTGYFVDQQRMQICLPATRLLTVYARSLPGRKIVVWISPGWPLLSASDTRIDERLQNITFHNVVDMAAQLRQARLTFYVINPLGATEATSSTFSYQQYVRGLDKPVNAKAGDLGLQVLSIQSGGLVFTGKTDIIGQLQQTFDDTANWYELTFPVPPGDRPDEYRQIQVNVDKPGLAARALTGYYAQP